MSDLFGGGAEAPDYTPVAQASTEAAQIAADLGREQLAENKRQYDQNMAVAAPVVQAQTDLMRQQQAQGDDYFNYMKQYSRPTETALFYEAMGFNPDEIAQIEQMRSTETAAAKSAAAAQPRTAMVSVPTQTTEQVLPTGAVRGDTIRDGKVVIGTTSGGPQYAAFPQLGNRSQPVYGTIDKNAYYVQNKDGTYSVVNPTTKTVDGTKMQEVALPGGGQSTFDTPETNAYINKLAAQVGLRQQDEAAATAIADSRKGVTDMTNMAIRNGLRYGMSADKIAAATAEMGTAQAQTQAAAAAAGREKAKNLSYAKKLDVAGLYKGLPGASQAAYGLTLNAGNAAVGNQNSTSAQYVNGITAGNNTILQGKQMQVNGLSNILNNQTSVYNSNNNGGALWGALGQVAGAWVGK